MNEIILKERELKENLVKVINDSELPAIIVKPVLKNFLEKINILEQQQYENALNNKQKTAE